MFNKLITDKYLKKFTETLNNLQCPYIVKSRTTPQKGKVLKELFLETDPTIDEKNAKIDKILSEGEKRAVALADFLTEVSIDEFCSVVVFDDPVTSLDLEWKDKLASILVKVSKSRQVIIFTHDVPFCYMMMKYAESNSVDIKTHIIERGSIDNKPGYVYLNNSPSSEEKYRNTNFVKEILDEAKKLEPEKQQNKLMQGFGALRTCYEVFINYDLLNQVIKRWDENIRVHNLQGIVWDKTIIEELIQKHETISRYIEGHSHSDLSPCQKPSVDLLKREITEFDNLKGKFKKLKKKII